MISFDKLFNEVLPENNITIYTLYAKLNVARSQIYRLKDSSVQLKTVDNILQLLYEVTNKKYSLDDICEFIPESKPEEEKEED